LSRLRVSGINWAYLYNAASIYAVHGPVGFPLLFTGLRSGEMYRTPEVNALQDRVLDEILAVVERKGIKLAEPDMRKKIKAHCRVRYNKPSMMQHVERGQRTEIDALNGALVREAKALGMAVPYNEAIVAVVKGVEKSRRQGLHEPARDYKKLEEEALAEAKLKP